MDDSSFRAAFSEWDWGEQEARLQLQDINMVECPACDKQPHSYHVDVNAKLWTAARQTRTAGDLRALPQPRYGGLLFVDNTSTVDHMEHLDLARAQVSWQPSAAHPRSAGGRFCWGGGMGARVKARAAGLHSCKP